MIVSGKEKKGFLAARRPTAPTELGVGERENKYWIFCHSKGSKYNSRDFPSSENEFARFLATSSSTSSLLQERRLDDYFYFGGGFLLREIDFFPFYVLIPYGRVKGVRGETVNIISLFCRPPLSPFPVIFGAEY